MRPPAPANPLRGATSGPGDSPIEVCDISQGGAWSRMMSDEIEIDDIGILPSQPSAPKRRAICATNYSLDEDIQLCESWENISVDPITGNERRLALEERKIANEEDKTLWEKEQIMFCDLEKLDPSQKTYVIAMRAQIAAQKMAAFNSTFGGSSGGHEASGGEEI